MKALGWRCGFVVAKQELESSAKDGILLEGH